MFQNVQLFIINLIMPFFYVIGDIIAGSGFEDAVLQSGVWSSGSLLAVLSEKHYNCTWNVHSGTFYI